MLCTKCCVGCCRPATVDGTPRGSLAELGYPGVLAGRRPPAAVLHARQGHPRHGQGHVPRQGARLHRRHPLGAPRDAAER